MNGMVIEGKKISIEEYLNEIKPYLKIIIIDLQKSDIWKNQLTITINFISSEETEEKQTMHSKNDNIEVMTYDYPDQITKERFDLLLSRYQIS